VKRLRFVAVVAACALGTSVGAEEKKPAPMEAAPAPAEAPSTPGDARPQPNPPEKKENSGLEAMGSLDKELIKKVIQSHRNEIASCYEAQLTEHPKLIGKVVIKFLITSTGSVATASTTQTTVNNSEMEKCIADSVRTWQFPKPKGGGVVVVSYPFMFRPGPSKAPLNEAPPSRSKLKEN